MWNGMWLKAMKTSTANKSNTFIWFDSIVLFAWLRSHRYGMVGIHVFSAVIVNVSGLYR